MTRMSLTLAACAAILSAPAGAQDYSGMAALEVLQGWQGEAGTHMAAFRITLQDGWKTYWRAPGDAGIPPSFTWSGSRNIARIAMHWPRPQVYNDYGLRTVGYKSELVLPIEITPRDAGAGLHVSGRMDIGVCRDVCVPVSLYFDSPLSPGQPGSDARIVAALSDRPQSATEAGVTAVTCRVEPISDGLRLTATLDAPSIGRKEVAIVEMADKAIWVSEAETRRTNGQLTVASDLVPTAAQPFALQRSDVTITVLAADRAYEVRGCTAG